jgi:putative serine protease PepD
MTGLICAVLGGSIGGLIVRHADRTGLVGSVTIGSVTDRGAVSERKAGSVAGVAAKILPSVVSINVKTSSGGDTGSGIVLSKSGYIMTNNHVIAAVRNSGGVLTVVLPDRTTVPAKVIGHPDPVDDIAVIKVSAGHSLTPAVLGNSNDIAVGDPVIAVGSPLGLAGTVTSGIVSALNRPVEAGGEGGPEDVIDAIQTDAAINPGNSGGPLVDGAGDVVGVNSAIASLSTDNITGQQSGSIGLGFAIPINEAARIAGQIMTQGYSTHAIIGVSLDPDFTGSGAQIGGPRGSGPAIVKNGPAAKAGMQAGDVIVALNGQKITTADELIVAIRSHVPGQRVTLTYDRGGHDTTVTVVLGSAPSE